jgi:hypothetical protein
MLNDNASCRRATNYVLNMTEDFGELVKSRADRSSRLATFGQPNSWDGGCDGQRPKREFRLLILYRPTNTGSASLRTSVVLVRAMVDQVQDVAEAY